MHADTCDESACIVVQQSAELWGQRRLHVAMDNRMTMNADVHTRTASRAGGPSPLRCSLTITFCLSFRPSLSLNLPLCGRSLPANHMSMSWPASPSCDKFFAHKGACDFFCGFQHFISAERVGAIRRLLSAHLLCQWRVGLHSSISP